MESLHEQVGDQQKRQYREGRFEIAPEKLPGAEGNDAEGEQEQENCR